MEIFDQNSVNRTPQQSPWTSVFIIFLLALAGFMLIGPFFGMLIAYFTYSGTPFEFMNDLTSPFGKDHIRVPHLIIQAGATLGLGLVPAYYWFRKGKNLKAMFTESPISPKSVWMAVLILICFVVVNSFFIEWNANFHFPEFLSDFEIRARALEDLAAKQTEYLTSFTSFGEFLIGFIVIAVFAGFAEEFVFRGMIQPELHRATKNIHVALWLSAALFSAMHMQFFGFVPRLLLGTVFGYLYYWSGNLWVPVVAHFINNGLSVILIYAGQTKIGEVDLESTEAAPLPLIFVSALLAAALIYFYPKRPVIHLP